MATRWFDVSNGWMFLAACKVDGVCRVVWQRRDNVASTVGMLGLDEAESVANNACKPFAVQPTRTREAFEFASMKQARAAVEAANQALQAAYPMEAPPWATLALVHGWTPPEVSQ